MKKVQWSYTEDPLEIERRLVEWNILHFNQASETPLANQTWCDKLDPCTKTDDELEHILHRRLSQDPDLCPTTKCFLEQIQSNIQKPMPKSMTIMTLEKFRAFYKKTAEDKSASPSGLHIRHYKAASKHEDFSLVVWKIMTLAYTNSYCLQRWRTSATALLEKVRGFPWIHKFRTIHIVESNLNYAMRSIWGREFMEYNENNNSFHDNQYGGRRGRQPQSAILNKVLSLEIIRHYGDDAALVDNDAKACCDRIIPYLTTYMLRRLGLPYFLTRFMCTVLKQIHYTIRLPQGQSATYDSSHLPLYGTGQGAGWSPPCWAANSDTISCCMGKHTPGLLLTYPNNKIKSHRHLDVFVDDTSLGITQDAIRELHNTLESHVTISLNIRDQIQHNMSFYNALLNLTGGALAWEKCEAYILQFHRTNGKKLMKKTKDMFPSLDVPDIFTDEIYQILLANPEEAFKMLGAYVAPDGNTDEQVKILLEKTTEWSEKLNRSYLTPTEAMVAYCQVLFPALIYPVAVLALTEAQCDKIISPAINALLKKTNLPITTARLLLYGPPRYGGRNLPNLYVQCYTMKLMMIIGHMQKSDITSIILDIVLGTAQQQVGINTPILESNFEKYSTLLEDGWVKKVWKFLNEMHGSLTIRHIWTPSKIYSNDISIMEKVLELDIPIANVQQVNLCRLHKRLYQVNEMFDNQQKYLHNDIFDPSKQSSTNDKFPIVIVPPQHWKTWELVIKTIYNATRVSGYYPGVVVNKFQGIWLQHIDRSHIVRHCGNGKFIKYKMESITRNVQTYTRNDWHFTMLSALDNYEIISVYENHGKVFTDGYKTTQARERKLTHTSQMPAYVYLQQRWNRIRKAWNTWKPTHSPTTHSPVYFRIDEKCDDPDLHSFTRELSTLDPSLQRNIGIITHTRNL